MQPIMLRSFCKQTLLTITSLVLEDFFITEAQPGGQTTNLRVGPHSPGWDPDHKGRVPFPRVGHFEKNHCISIQNTKKGKNLNRAIPCNSKRCKLSIDINYSSFDCMV